MRGGERVFNETKQAIQDLKLLINQGQVAAAALHDLIDQLVRECRLLAVTGIQDLTAQGTRARQVAQAESELAKGDDAITTANFETAIDHYRNALATGSSFAVLTARFIEDNSLLCPRKRAFPRGHRLSRSLLTRTSRSSGQCARQAIRHPSRHPSHLR